MPGAKRIVFTINNPKLGNIHAMERLFQSPDVVWSVYQYEIGVRGTVHLQGTCYFKDRKTLLQVKDMLQGISNGCGCWEHPVYADSDSDADLPNTVEGTPEPELVID